MNELLEALGLKLEFDYTYIRLIRSIDYVAEAEQLKQQYSQMQYSVIMPYHTPKPPDILWFYQTEFGSQLEKYEAKLYQSTPSYKFSPSISGLYSYPTMSSGQLSIGGVSSTLSQQIQLSPGVGIPIDDPNDP